MAHYPKIFLPEGGQGPQGDIGPQGLQGDIGVGGFNIPYLANYNQTYFINQSIVFDSDSLYQATQLHLSNYDGPTGAYLAGFYNDLITQCFNSSPNGSQAIYIKIQDAVNTNSYDIFGINLNLFDISDPNGALLTGIFYVGGTMQYQPTNVVISFQLNSGERGTQGFQGDQGTQGDIGIQGDQGPQGDIGVQGPQGNDGIAGNQGAAGTQGLRGFQGVQGTQGFQGVQGASGTGSVATASFYTQGGNAFGATATIGTIDNRNLNFLLNNTISLSMFTASILTTGGSAKISLGTTTSTSATIFPFDSQLAIYNQATNGTVPAIYLQNKDASIIQRTFIGMNSGLSAPSMAEIGLVNQSGIMFFRNNATTNWFSGSNNGSDQGLSLVFSGYAFTPYAALNVSSGAQHNNGIGYGIKVTSADNSGTGGMEVISLNVPSLPSGSGTQSLITGRAGTNVVFYTLLDGSTTIGKLSGTASLVVNGSATFKNTLSTGTVSNATASNVKIGKPIAASVSLDTTKYIEVSIDGVTYKVAVVA